MSSCPEYQSLVDRHGDLDSAQRADLDTHMASCRGCSQYKASADRAAQWLRTLRNQAAPLEPVDQAFESLSSRLSASKRQLVWGLVLVALCIAAPFAMLVRGELPFKVWALLAGALAVAAIGVGQIRRGQTAMLRLTERAGDFYATWRHDIEKQLRLLTGGGVLAAVSCVAFLGFSILAPFGVVERLVVLSAAFLTAFAALHTFVVELPQLRGELRLVRDAEGA